MCMQFATRLRTHAVLPRRQLSVIFVQLTLIFVQLTLIFHPTPASRRRMRPAKRYLRPAKRYLRAAKPYLRCRHCRRQSARGLQKKELAPPSLHTLSLELESRNVAEKVKLRSSTDIILPTAEVILQNWAI